MLHGNGTEWASVPSNHLKARVLFLATSFGTEAGPAQPTASLPRLTVRRMEYSLMTLGRLLRRVHERNHDFPSEKPARGRPALTSRLRGDGDSVTS